LSRAQIRRLAPEDAVVYQVLRLRGLLESPSAFGSSHAEESTFTNDFVRSRLDVKVDSGVFGAFVDVRLVGLVALGRERMLKLAHKANLWGMYVAPESRGHGHARTLLAAALELANAVPEILQVNLCVNANNTSAIRLYESVGFRTYGREADGLCIDGVLHDELHMQLKLERA
jgi:ribosomal protein S18 acetylase RimI-like enzyme